MSGKDKYYFSHDSNARRDPKMIPIIHEFGSTGYGMFWILIEILREQSDYKIDITKSYMILSLSTEMRVTTDEVSKFIDKCIENQLIETDGIYVWSNSLCKRMEIYEAKKKRYSDMGKKRWSSNNKLQEPETKTTDDPQEKSDVFSFRKALIEIGVSKDTADAWLEVRRKKKAVNTKLAFERIHSQIRKSGYDAEFCIRTAAEKSWHGFEASYLDGISTRGNNNNGQMVY